MDGAAAASGGTTPNTLAAGSISSPPGSTPTGRHAWPDTSHSSAACSTGCARCAVQARAPWWWPLAAPWGVTLPPLLTACPGIRGDVRLDQARQASPQEDL